MAVHSDEHERTMAFAEIALGQIKALLQPAIPRNYEIWYTYATGYNPSLNRTINEMLARNEALSAADLEQIYETYLSPGRLTESIDAVGARVVGEIEHVMAMVDAAVGTTSSYTERLADVSFKLGDEADRENLRTMVEALVRSTREVQQNNSSLEARLKASKQEISQLQENLETVRNESLADPLTGLANRKYFDQMLERAVAECRADNEALCLVLADIDHFKKFNDSYGHLTGDQVLRLVAQAVKQNVKGRDLAARFGGEEFAIVLPNIPLRQALTMADQIRRAVASKELVKRSTGENLGRVTISLGVALLQRGEPVQMLIERADSCLSAAKRGGRNLVICGTDPEVRPSVESRVA